MTLSQPVRLCGFGVSDATRASEVVDLGVVTVQAIADWLEVKPVRSRETNPLFTALD